MSMYYYSIFLDFCNYKSRKKRDERTYVPHAGG